MLEAQSINQTFQEYLLLDYVQRLEARKFGHRAVHIHLSRLKSFHRRDFHVRVATNTFESYVKLYVGRIFVLSNNDLLFIWKDKSIADVEPGIDTLRYLFRDDPLSQDDSEETGFCTWYNLNTEYPDFLLLAEHLNEQAKKRSRAEKRTKQVAPALQPLDATNLAQLEDTIATADLAQHIRQQTVCVITNEGVPHPVFDEFFVSIAELRDALMPTIDLSANRWLFQHLTEVLDKRVLNYLCRRTFRTSARSFSVNLNLLTLREREFKRFDDVVRTEWPGNLLIELNQVDLFANLELYLTARTELREKGYRILLDSLTVEALPFIKRNRLDADFIKIGWRREMTDAVIRKKYSEMDTVVDQVGKERVIMCHCDSPQAIRFGRGLGITLFQGRYVDDLLKSRNRRRAAR